MDENIGVVVVDVQKWVKMEFMQSERVF